MDLSEHQRTIIIALRKNGRQKIHSLAQKNMLPTSSLTEALHRMEDKGILEHHTHIAFEKLGYPVRIFAAIKTDKNSRQRLQADLSSARNINTLHLIDSGYDFHFEGIFRNHQEARDFMDELEEKNTILEKHIFQVIDTIHQERFLTEKGHYD